MTHDAMTLFGAHKDQTMPTEHFIKLTEQTFGEIIINTSAITFIDIDGYKICVRNTDIHGNGMLQLTKESMTKLLHCIDYD